MKIRILLYLTILFIHSNAGILKAQPSEELKKNTVEINKGKAPIIDGEILVDEWSDSKIININDSTFIYVKYDDSNLYVATNSVIGNVFFVHKSKLYVYHASNSLGMAIYNLNEDHNLWACEESYFWKLMRSQTKNKTKLELQEMVKTHLIENGWTASTKPMSEKRHTEFAFSLERFGLNPVISNKMIIDNIMIYQHPNCWPLKDKGNKDIYSLICGGRPDIINFDYSNWGKLEFK